MKYQCLARASVEHYLYQLRRCTGKPIFIDEIENGIHYSVIKDIIKSLISSAKQNNNQIFATTHSQDVIRAINEIDSKNEDIAYIRLEEKVTPKANSRTIQYG